MKVTNMRVQGLDNPLGIQARQPVFSYELEKDEHDTKEECIYQKAFRVLVSGNRELLEEETGDMWDSGMIEQKEPFGIIYKGKMLSSRSIYYWKVKVWDNLGNDLGWSQIHTWEMGLYPENWRGEWIGQGEDYAGDKAEAPLFVCDFTAGIFDMERARLYISGLGIFKAFLNGMELADTLFDPGECDVTKTVYYVTYDVTKMLRNGQNTLGVILGNGQYTNFQMNPVMALPDGTLLANHRYQKNDGQFVKPGIAGNKKLIAQLEITNNSGKRIIVSISDEKWKWNHGPCVFQNWYGGEDYDATVEIPDWNIPEGKRDSWKPTAKMNIPAGKLMAREFMPIKIIRKNNAMDVRKLENGNWLADMGHNGAGFPEITIQTTPAMKGIWVRMYPAELLNEEKTGVDQSSCTQSWNKKYKCAIIDSYRLKGTGTEIWHPSFSYQGFRYVEVEGLPNTLKKEDIRYCTVHTDNKKRGFFHSSDERLDRINSMVERSIESNMYSVFTDCPQIEKLGWIETSHLMLRSLAGTYDISAWMKKIIHDIADSQIDEEQTKIEGNEPVGFIPAIIPEFQRIVGLHHDPNWNGACIFTPWEYYQYYGDIEILREMYPVMERYLRYLTVYVKNGILDNYAQMGEWGEYGEKTPTVLVATCAYYRMLRIMEQVARILDKQEEEEGFRKEAERTKEAFHVHPQCYDSSKEIYGNGSQASYGCVLFSGIVPQERNERTVNKLVEAVKAKEYHLSSGEVGLKQVLWALAENGKNEIAYKMIMNETSPSYAFFADAGLTTLPEYWNCEELWCGMARSRNHAMMGHVKEWITFYMLGIKSLEAGFSRIKLCPWMPDTMEFLEGKVHTPYGDIYVRCKKENNKMTVESDIPPGITVVD